MNLLEARINLDAIAANTAKLKAKVAPAKLMCVVKADGYNHGALKVAQVMQEAGADQFGVATFAEALALHQSGVQRPIMCWLWSPDQNVAEVLDAGITVAVASKSQVQAVLQHGRGKVVIKIDTGMHRSGVLEQQWEEIMRALAHSELEVTGLMSHFACADDLESSATDEQIAVFKRAIELGRSLGLALPCNHIANSPAVLSRPDAYFEMVRPGIALYGYEPIKDSNHGLEAAMQWVARVTVVKKIAAGDAVSYGHTWRAPHDGAIAIVPAGYADGLARAAQGHLEVTIGGKRFQQVGRVCMDQIVVFLGADEAGVQPGDEAVIFGPGGMSAGELADALGTIDYEIVCSPKGRTRRVYQHTHTHLQEQA
ncbi:alanine racemase [Corynebacterium pelargi]|uniref:Alanine racemase n=1 Tax=Corynebacterium pelargi TaxID=1471400 RepID=A0A410WAR9_9CORY|nr:alanine racemase [Corynebacterium pelargi]QAU53045.1 Alanine racemase [Corynebacterium pelargi]GGG75229.1 alanine racemase [Corynebacterium pelargi]